MLGLALRPVPLMVNRNDLQPALLILEIVLHSIDVPTRVPRAAKNWCPAPMPCRA